MKKRQLKGDEPKIWTCGTVHEQIRCKKLHLEAESLCKSQVYTFGAYPNIDNATGCP
jgi:hypothetical protein